MALLKSLPIQVKNGIVDFEGLSMGKWITIHLVHLSKKTAHLLCRQHYYVFRDLWDHLLILKINQTRYVLVYTRVGHITT